MFEITLKLKILENYLTILSSLKNYSKINNVSTDLSSFDPI